jgi:hypothetical protein
MSGKTDDPTAHGPEVRSPEQTSKPKHDGPQEIEDAAEQELEYPADETDEG